MRRSEGLLWLAVLGGLAALAGAGLWRAMAPGERGPREPVWDRQPCAECGMLLSDPAFACQARDPRGDTLFFDDPGCLLAYLKGHPDARGVYFHRLKGAGWLSTHDSGFVAVARSPMGYRLGCVAAGDPGARGFAWAEARVAARLGGPGPAGGGGRP